MKMNMDEVLLRQNIPMNRIQNSAIRISEVLEEMNLISESDSMNHLVTNLDDSIYAEMCRLHGRSYFGNQDDYITCFALLKKIGYTDVNTIEHVISRIIM
jgi:hypothetical protein